MKIKSKILGLVAAVCLVPATAEIKLSARVEASVDAYSGTVVTNPDNEMSGNWSHDGFKNVSFGETNFAVDFNWEDKAGFLLKVRPGKLLLADVQAGFDFDMAAAAFTFKDTNVWAKFGNIMFAQMGWFENRSVPLLNAVIDEWVYGPVFLDKTLSTPAQTIGDLDAFRNIMFKFYAGPVAIDVAPWMRHGLEWDTKSLVWPEATKTPLGIENSLAGKQSESKRKTYFSPAVRLQYIMPDMFTVAAAYMLDYEAGSYYDPSHTASGNDKIVGRHWVNVIAKLDMIKDLTVAASYGLMCSNKTIKWTHDLPGSDKQTVWTDDWAHAVDLRIQYEKDAFKFNSHNKFSGSMNSINYKYNDMENTLEKSDDQMRYMNIWNSVAASYSFNNSIEVGGVIVNKYTRQWFTRENTDKTDKNVFSFRPFVRYNISDNIFVKGGLRVDVDANIETKNTGTVNKTYTITPAVPITISVGF